MKTEIATKNELSIKDLLFRSEEEVEYFHNTINVASKEKGFTVKEIAKYRKLHDDYISKTGKRHYAKCVGYLKGCHFGLPNSYKDCKEFVNGKCFRSDKPFHMKSCDNTHKTFVVSEPDELDSCGNSYTLVKRIICDDGFCIYVESSHIKMTNKFKDIRIVCFYS